MFTWGVTALGAAFVFFFKEVNQKILDAMMGFAAGVMLAASYWSLLAPAIEMSELTSSLPKWAPPLIGFLSGGIFLSITDKVIPHLHPGFKMEQAEGPKTQWKRKILLVLAITLHNIPEGLAIGVAFGAVAYGLESATIGAAIALAIGIGLQNFPEGAAVSLPLRRDGMGRGRSFFWGQLSAAVEPIAAVIGAALVMTMQPILPYALAFAAGAMIFVVMEELIPEAHRKGSADLVAYATLIGFSLMMTLDVALG
ncbi:MAG: ZIP family metal transporter [Saprospiraceae bacterium]|nr:ZIP family metal transporter [Saprospiraceae bacterium]